MTLAAHAEARPGAARVGNTDREGRFRSPLVVKVGGELLENSSYLSGVVAAVSELARRGPLVVVHGGGKEIDAALRTAGIEKRQVDGLRITDEATLDVVVSVLAGTVNTRFVATLNAAGVPAVGLTGADANSGLSAPAAPHPGSDGRPVDLGRVGIPEADSTVRLLDVLTREGFVPVLASIGVDRTGKLLNVNADTLAGHLATRTRARRLVIAGTTAGVLDEHGATVPRLDPQGVDRLIGGGAATAGMIAKLRACARVVADGTCDVVIVDGRDPAALVGSAGDDLDPRWTRIADRPSR